MAYLVRIGAIRENRSGVGSRGYHVFRRGTVVIIDWGGVEVLRNRRFHWISEPQGMTYRRRSVENAKALLLEIVQDQIGQGYSRLPVGVRILPRRGRIR